MGPIHPDNVALKTIECDAVLMALDPTNVNNKLSAPNKLFEAMAAGCPVLAANLPAHNEVIPKDCLLPAADVSAWSHEITNIHAAWKRAGGVPRNPEDSLIEHIRENLSPEAHGEALSRAYEKAFR